MDTDALAGAISEAAKKLGWKDILIILGIIIGGFLVIKLLLSIIKKAIFKTKLTDGTKKTVVRVIKVVVYGVVLITTFMSLGIDMTSIVALISALSLGVSLAAESVLSNLAGGIVIRITQPFVVGDFIIVGEHRGEVKGIKLNYTEMLSVDGTTVVIPNKAISDSNLVNCTKVGVRRIETNVSASYDSGTENVFAALKAAAKRQKTILDTPAPETYITSFNANDVSYVMFTWVRSVDYITTRLKLGEAVREEFAKHGVKFAYPHVVLTQDSSIPCKSEEKDRQYTKNKTK